MLRYQLLLSGSLKELIVLPGLIRRPLLHCLLFLTLSSFAIAEVVFESTTIDLRPAAEENIVEGVFPFRIDDGSLTIKKSDTPCSSCLGVQILPEGKDVKEKNKWRKGEKGLVKARFAIGNLRGTVDKEIVVLVNGKKKKLLCRLHVPVLFQIEPASHRWEINGSPDKKVFTVKVTHSDPIRITEHSGSGKNFTYKIVTVKEGWEYKITMKPKSTEKIAMGRISINTDCKIERQKRHQIYGFVNRVRK